MEKEAMISIENLNKQFKNQLVLNNINVKFSNGHIYGIIGRNGSGYRHPYEKTWNYSFVFTISNSKLSRA